MNEITILTPTYNRAEYLPRLYESLLKQSDQGFEWLVVDDGSEDGTGELLERYLRDARLTIRYIRQENGGKHRALNRGIREINTQLTFIVDSDDYLPENAVGLIREYHARYRTQYLESIREDALHQTGENPNRTLLCGYSFLRCHSDGRVNTAYFPENEMIGTYRDVRINGGIAGDKAEVFYTEILKKYPFPVFEGEKFLAEDLVWMQMSGPYRMVHINENVYYCDYLPGGLTDSGHRMKMHSPKGMTLRSAVYLQDPQVKFSVTLKMMLLYEIYGEVAGYQKRELYRKSGHPFLYAVCVLPAKIIREKWKKEA